MPKTAYSYVRFSTPEQARGDSLRRQVERSERWCKENAALLDDSLRDLGISAFRGANHKKGALGGFLEAIKSGSVRLGSILIVESLDRLSRAEIDEALELVRGILRAGVEIVTLNPERHYDRRSLNDAFALMEFIVIAMRANEESKRKSERLGEAWANKRRKASAEKMTCLCPAWLRLTEDRKRFEKIPEAVDAVRLIFDLCIDGLGINSITRKMNSIDVRPIGKKGKAWSTGYVRKILTARAVLGEYQPHVYDDQQRRRPHGEPIKGYFPAIITEAVFARAQSALRSRLTQRGPKGEKVTNLFTGIIFNAVDDSPMNIKAKPNGPFLYSAARRNGVNGSSPGYFSYEAFESAFLQTAVLLKPSDILPAKADANKLETMLEGEQALLELLKGKLEKAKSRFKIDPDSDALLDLIQSLESEIKTKQGIVERLRNERHSASDDVLGDAQHIVSLLKEAQGLELVELRTRLKAKLRSLIERIDLFIPPLNTYLRFAISHVFFKGGRVRTMVTYTYRSKLVYGTAEYADLGEIRDLRDRRIQQKLTKWVKRIALSTVS